MIWVINSNSNTCRIYHYEKKPLTLNLLKEIQHPENKLRSIDLVSDRPGHYKASGSAHGAYSPETDPKDVKIEQFCREIANDLAHERSMNSYDKLIMIAPPSVNGMLFQHLDKHVKNLVTHNIQKDLSHLPAQELLAFLKEHTRYTDE